jgi:hypothetical protein
MRKVRRYPADAQSSPDWFLLGRWRDLRLRVEEVGRHHEELLGLPLCAFPLRSNRVSSSGISCPVDLQGMRRQGTATAFQCSRFVAGVRISSAGLNRFRFQGCVLSLLKAPLANVQIPKVSLDRALGSSRKKAGERVPSPGGTCLLLKAQRKHKEGSLVFSQAKEGR